MNQKNKLFHRVNWVDGMKVNKDSFIAIENSITQYAQLNYGNNLNPNNYGLLPDYYNNQERTLLNISMDGRRTLVVHIYYCNAVTLGGHRIMINEEVNKLMEQSNQIPKYKFKVSSNEGTDYVILSVNPYKRIPVGQADPEEEPARHPYVIPEYTVSVVSEVELISSVIGMQHIPIGLIEWKNGEPELNADFIPPCTSIQSHQDLKFSYDQIGVFFNKIELYASQILQKIIQKKQTNDLAVMVQTICADTRFYLQHIIPQFRANDKYAPPVVLFTRLSSMASIVKGSLDVYSGIGKEELINYLTDWSNQTQGAFENTLDVMIDFEYKHHNINAALEQAAAFINPMIVLFKKLSELDYIGKKEGLEIFVKEEEVENELGKKSRFILE